MQGGGFTLTGTVADTYNAATLEGKAGRSQIQGQPDNSTRHCLKIKFKKGWGYKSMIECLPITHEKKKECLQVI